MKTNSQECRCEALVDTFEEWVICTTKMYTLLINALGLVHHLLFLSDNAVLLLTITNKQSLIQIGAWQRERVWPGRQVPPEWSWAESRMSVSSPVSSVDIRFRPFRQFPPTAALSSSSSPFRTSIRLVSCAFNDKWSIKLCNLYSPIMQRLSSASSTFIMRSLRAHLLILFSHPLIYFKCRQVSFRCQTSM